MPFDIMFPDKAKEMKRMVFDYLKGLQIANNAVGDTKNQQTRGSLQINENGFPVAPRPHLWTKVVRADIEPIYRLYITHHYRKLFYSSKLIYNKQIYRTGLSG